MESGYPRGFVNLPMAGDLCLPGRNAFCAAARGGANCTAKSLLVVMQETGSYAFAHKLGCGRELRC